MSRARILEWIFIFFSRESAWSRDGTCISCIARWILCTLSHQGSPFPGLSSLEMEINSFDATHGCITTLALCSSDPPTLVIVNHSLSSPSLISYAFASKCRTWYFVLSLPFTFDIASFHSALEVSKSFWILFLPLKMLANISKTGVTHKFGKLEHLSSSRSSMESMEHGHSPLFMSAGT